MTPISGLTVFRLDRRAKRLTLASWHSPHSLTWRWLVDVSLGWRWKPYASFHRNLNGSGHWSASFLCVGLNGHWQQALWYRKLYMRMRDEEDQRCGMLWVSDSHPHKLHDLPSRPPEPTVSAPLTLQ